MIIKEDYSLKSLNTFHIDAHSKYFVEIFSQQDFLDLIKDPGFVKLKKLFLGGGSNILFSKDFSGIIIQNRIAGISLLEESDQYVKIKVGSGVNWHELVEHTLSKGWYGLENLAFIPGTVGAAPIQNIGAYGMELKDFFVSLSGYDVKSGKILDFKKEQSDFSYRNSIFKKKYKNKLFITEVILRLHKNPFINIKYKALQDFFEGRKINTISPNEVFDAVVEIRKSKLPDPDQIGNGGSFFKNPVLPDSQFNKIKDKNPDLPFYLEDKNRVKIPAAFLIEACGWKGFRKNDAGVHNKQALVLVNYGNAKGKEIVSLAKEIQQSVNEKFHIRLEPEVNII